MLNTSPSLPFLNANNTEHKYYLKYIHCIILSAIASTRKKSIVLSKQKQKCFGKQKREDILFSV